MVLHNSRICPLQTLAIDFTKNLYGKASYNGYTPEQVLTGWMFYADDWMQEPMLRLKGAEMRDRLQLPEYVPVGQQRDGRLHARSVRAGILWRQPRCVPFAGGCHRQ
jgi:hypothetical protein